MATESVSLFISYSHKDDELRKELTTHLMPLRRQGLISTWYDRMIEPGSKWDEAIKAQLMAADIILLLLSADFIASDYCADVEIQAAMDRHLSGDAVVIPVVLRDTYWKNQPYAALQSFPPDAKPVTDTDAWPQKDKAFVKVAEGIEAVAHRLIQARQLKRALQAEKEQSFRELARHVTGDGTVSGIERARLEELRGKLALLPAVADRIVAEELAPSRKRAENLAFYAATFQAEITRAYPVTDQSRQELAELQEQLLLPADAVARVEAPLIVQAEARYQASRLAPPAAQTPTAALHPPARRATALPQPGPAATVAGSASASAPAPAPASESAPAPAPPSAPIPAMAFAAPLVPRLSKLPADRPVSPAPAPKPAPAPVAVSASLSAAATVSAPALLPSPPSSPSWWVKLLKWAGWLLVALFVLSVLAEL